MKFTGTEGAIETHLQREQASNEVSQIDRKVWLAWRITKGPHFWSKSRDDGLAPRRDGEDLKSE